MTWKTAGGRAGTSTRSLEVTVAPVPRRTCLRTSRTSSGSFATWRKSSQPAWCCGCNVILKESDSGNRLGNWKTELSAKITAHPVICASNRPWLIASTATAFPPEPSTLKTPLSAVFTTTRGPDLRHVNACYIKDDRAIPMPIRARANAPTYVILPE